MKNLPGVIGLILRRLFAEFIAWPLNNHEMMAQFYGIKVIVRCLNKDSSSVLQT